MSVYSLSELLLARVANGFLSGDMDCTIKVFYSPYYVDDYRAEELDEMDIASSLFE